MDGQYVSNANLVRYITPERGGTLRYDGNIETNEGHDPSWLNQVRRKNQFNQFRESSVLNFRRLEIQVLRAIETEPDLRASTFTFDAEVEKINTLLDRIKIRRADSQSFEVLDRENDQVISPETLSSGESELISLAVEILLFARLCRTPNYTPYTNWFLMDEPDVHLHPDLQYRLMQLIASEFASLNNGRILIATHSTSILSSLTNSVEELRIGFKVSGNPVVKYELASETLQKLLPMFGAHPLSSVFNQRPILIVEGEDDERIWSQVERTSKGRIKVFPCVAGDIQSIDAYEIMASRLIEAVYDNGVAYSIRDRDESTGDLSDAENVRRARLACRAAENLVLSDDVLELLGTNWKTMKSELENWLKSNAGHVRFGNVEAFRSGGWNRKTHSIKEIRNLVVGLSGSNKPWEIAVGQAISGLSTSKHAGPNSLSAYLGSKVVSMLNLK